MKRHIDDEQPFKICTEFGTVTGIGDVDGDGTP